MRRRRAANDNWEWGAAPFSWREKWPLVIAVFFGSIAAGATIGLILKQLFGIG